MILVDISEPDKIIKLLKQACPVTTANLNQMKMSDYFFGNYEGKKFQFSRKQAAELVGNIDEAEDQIRDYYNHADENFQIVEGIISPVALYSKSGAYPVQEHSAPSRRITTKDLSARLFCYHVEDGGFIRGGHSFSTASASMLYAWIHRLAEAGVVTYWTITQAETATLLSTIYHNEQKPPEDHNTLQRIIRPRIQVTDADQLTKSLVYLSAVYKLGIGETKAKALASKFSSILDIATAPVKEIESCAGVGKVIADKLRKALGGEE